MSDDRFFDKYERAARLAWTPAPQRLRSRSVPRPQESPLPELASHAEASDSGRAADVRSLAAGELGSGQMETHKLAGLDVTLMVIPPAGDDLHEIRGCVWLHETSAQPIRVALTSGSHVMDVIEVNDGDDFVIKELLGDEWSLEFHLPDGRAAVLRIEP